MTSPAARDSRPAAAATASTSRTRRQLDEIHASRGGRVALGGASACRGLPRGPEGQGMPASGAARNAGTNATLANARQNGIVDSVDSKSPSSSSRARASSSGSVSSAIAPRASASRYARSAAPRRTAAATRTGSAEAAEPPSTSSRAAASTARAANKIPSAPSFFFTPNSFTSASARRPSSKGARGKKRFASSSFRAFSKSKTAAMTDTRGSNRSPGLFSSISDSSESERDSRLESAARRVGTHRERRTASRVRSASPAPVHDARESRTCVTHASRTRDARLLDTEPFSKPGNTCFTSASVTVTLFARRRDSNSAPSPSASSLRNAPRGNRSGSNACEAGGSKRDAAGYVVTLSPDDRVCSSSFSTSGERNPRESTRKGLPPARARNGGPPADPRDPGGPADDPAAFSKPPAPPSAVSKTGSARNRSSRAPSTAPPGASGANHRVCIRNARSARRAETPSTFSERLSLRRLSNAPGTTLAAARHLSSGTDSGFSAVSVWNASAAFNASGVAAARATAESSTPAAEAGRA